MKKKDTREGWRKGGVGSRTSGLEQTLSLLPEDGSWIRFQDLNDAAQKAGPSKPTLVAHLKEHLQKKRIERRTDKSMYPPAVFYRRTPLAIYPLGKEIHDQIFGDPSHWIREVVRNKDKEEARQLLTSFFKIYFSLSAVLLAKIIDLSARKESPLEALEYADSLLQFHYFPIMRKLIPPCILEKDISLDALEESLDPFLTIAESTLEELGIKVEGKGADLEPEDKK